VRRATRHNGGVASFTGFVRDAIASPRGFPDRSRTVAARIRDLDDRMRLLDAMTWTIVPVAVVTGLRSFGRIVRADLDTPASHLAADATICTWAIVATAMTKSWHARAREHTEVMKELIVLGVSGADARR
jgi:hypothetical protein